MNNKKQKLLLEYLMSSTDTFAVCQSIVQPEYFDPEYRRVVKFMKQYFNEFNTTPNRDQILAETDVELQHRDVSRDEVQYTTQQIETFCRQRAIERAILSSPKLLENEDYGTLEKNIRDAIMVSLHHNLGLRYFEDPEERLKRMLDESPVEPTGWDEVDKHLFGGISRKELLLVSANSGGGKSITLSNLGFNFVSRGLNVLYVSLELSEDVVAQRFDTMFTGVSRKDWKSHVNEITTRLSNAKDGAGILDIIQMPSGTCANDVRAYLKEYYLHYNVMPDMLILDYLDKMNPNEKVDLGNVWTKDKLVAEQLRDIGVDYNMFVATASQLNRCLDPSSVITLADWSTIELQHIKIGDVLMSYDPDRKELTNVVVTAMVEEEHDEYYVVELEDGSTVTCSGNHIFRTVDGREVSINSGLGEGDYLFVA